MEKMIGLGTPNHHIVESEVVHFFAFEISCFLDILGVQNVQTITDDTTIDDVLDLGVALTDLDNMLASLFPGFSLEGDMTILDAMSQIFHINPSWPIRRVH